jgi:hypothetical protein
METGAQPFYCNLVALRDGLIVTHAAAYDASLLKDQIPIVTRAIGSGAGYFVNMEPANSFALTFGHVTFGQHVKVTWSKATVTATNPTAVVECGTLRPGTVYKVANVYGQKGNAFTLVSETGTAQTFTIDQATAAGIMYVTTVVPFIFPLAYKPENYRAALGVTASTEGKLPAGTVAVQSSGHLVQWPHERVAL